MTWPNFKQFVKSSCSDIIEWQMFLMLFAWRCHVVWWWIAIVVMMASSLPRVYDGSKYPNLKQEETSGSFVSIGKTSRLRMIPESAQYTSKKTTTFQQLKTKIALEDKGSAHDMFSRFFRVWIYEFFNQILNTICFGFLKCNWEKMHFWQIEYLFSFSTQKYWWKKL